MMLKRFLPTNVLVALSTLCLTLVYSLWIVTPVHAYTVRPPNIRWNTTHIPTYTETSAYVSYGGTAWVQSLRDPIAEWNSKAQPYGWFFWWRYDAVSNNKVTVSTTLPLNKIGNTVVTYNIFSIVQTLVEVNINTGNGLWDGVHPAYFPSNYLDLRSILRHEIGHAAALCHSAIFANVMYPSAPLPGTSKLVQTNDFYGLMYMYYSQGSPVPPESSNCWEVIPGT